ncbi:GtrA family protein [Allosphingosinicella indica]|uniref:Putative flippase GtrA (Transmembrane translocase of bactoprenol-linked glucose) n=1 Tax=Allosphingosinicella indica TaxID=941907 RepID=A0A1X7GCV5_9SPHN|nr:GtrA family protein [Allosphingosinicella indica]SMF67169.1 Putative flippase GtrA (transmembrane translocase of bactoprenol-linked glucose) [Allosphingosinicella indica]
MLDRLKSHEALIGQLVRYALTGGLASFVNIGVYWVLAARGMDPNLAWAIGFVAAVAVGYVVHSRWSFRGHGRRGNLARTGGRFVIVALVSFALNQFWVWLLVARAGLPLWAPYPLVLGVTPLVVFALNRRWVFG